MRSTNRLAGVSLLLLAALFFTLGLSSTAAVAKPLDQQSGQTVTIAAGQSTTLQVRGFCIDPGKAFPTGISTPDSLATDAVRAGLNYAVGKGYDQSNPRQVQEAVWFLQTGTWQSTDHQLADEIANAAKDAANAPSTPTGTSLLDVLKANNAKATITFKAAPDVQPNQAFYGDGTLTITNTGSQSIQVYLPFGAVFPPANSAEQRLVGYAVGVSQAGTATVAATGTAPAATAAATGTAVTTGTVAPTETVATTATTAATETPAATSTVAATATTAATETPAPTETTAATATTAPTETPMAMATETPQSSVLPTTGAGPGGFPGWLLLFGLSLASLGAGVALLRRNPTTN